MLLYGCRIVLSGLTTFVSISITFLPLLRFFLSSLFLASNFSLHLNDFAVHQLHVYFVHIVFFLTLAGPRFVQIVSVHNFAAPIHVTDDELLGGALGFA